VGDGGKKQKCSMKQSRQSFSLEEGKIQASILLKSIRSVEPDFVSRSIKRFLVLPEFAQSNGTMKIHSEAGYGTSIQITFPRIT
jgi:hypothetical protein